MRRYLPKSHRDGYSDAESQSLETSPTHRMYSHNRHNTEHDIARLQQARAALSKGNSPSLARSEEMLPESVEMKVDNLVPTKCRLYQW